MLLNDNNNLIKKVTFFYDSKNTNMAGPPSSQSELSYEHDVDGGKVGHFLYKITS